MQAIFVVNKFLLRFFLKNNTNSITIKPDIEKKFYDYQYTTIMPRKEIVKTNCMIEKNQKPLRLSKRLAGSTIGMISSNFSTRSHKDS